MAPSTALVRKAIAESYHCDKAFADVHLGTDDGNMIFIEHTSDFEMFSSTGAGAIQGYGYEFHKDGANGARILRFYDVTSFSIHDIILVDAPLFHLVLDSCDSGEVYNMLIRGANKGGLDGIDVWSTNIYIHDVMVWHENYLLLDLC